MKKSILVVAGMAACLAWTTNAQETKGAQTKPATVSEQTFMLQAGEHNLANLAAAVAAYLDHTTAPLCHRTHEQAWLAHVRDDHPDDPSRAQKEQPPGGKSTTVPWRGVAFCSEQKATEPMTLALRISFAWAATCRASRGLRPWCVRRCTGYRGRSVLFVCRC